MKNYHIKITIIYKIYTYPHDIYISLERPLKTDQLLFELLFRQTVNKIVNRKN